MRILVRLAFILSILSMPLSGCMETGAQREVDRIQTQNAAAGADGEACLQAAFDKSQYTGIVKKGGFNFSTFSLQMLNDPSFPTKDEIKSLYAIYADIQDCRQLVLGGSGKAHQMYCSHLSKASPIQIVYGQSSPREKCLGANSMKEEKHFAKKGNAKLLK